MQKSFVLLLYCLLFGGYKTMAQAIFYSNPIMENETLDTEYPHYLIGQMNQNILIGRINEKGFYIGVYNDKMGLQNNVLYQALNPNYFQILDAVNLNDVGLLLVAQKATNELENILVYSVTFSETGVPISEEQVIDTISASRYAASRIFKVGVSENRKFVLVTMIEERPNGFFIRTILLSSDNTVVAKYIFSLPVARNEFLQDFQIDNDGNVYVFKQTFRERILAGVSIYFLQPNNPMLFQRMEFPKLKIKELNVQLNNFTKRIYFYAIYGGSSRADIGGIYSIFYDIAANNFQGEHMLPLNKLIPDMKSGQAINLHLNEMVFLKDSGMIVNAQIRYSMQKGGNLNNYGGGTLSPFGSPFASPFGMYGYGGGFGGMGGNYGFGGLPNQSFGGGGGSGSVVDYHADNVYIFALDKYYNLKKAAVLYKNQQQNTKDYYLDFSIMNMGNKLNYLYNDFLSTGEIALNSYTLDPKYNFIKKSLATKQNKSFSFMIRRGKQITPHSFLAPCVFQNKLVSFGLIIL